jgi:hypothetical protein
MRRWVTVFLLIACTLSGCDQREVVAKITPKEDEEFAKHYISLFQRSDFAAIEAPMDSGLKTPQLRPTLTLMTTMLPPEPPVSIEVVGVEVTRSSDGSSTTNLTLHYEFSRAWVLANIIIRRAGGAPIVDGITFTPLQASWKEINGLTFAGKPFSSYAILALSILAPIFMIASLILCIAAPIQRRKWLWCIVVFLSVGSFGVNWTTGEVDFSLLQFGLLPMSFGQLGIDGPYYFQAGIPAGAIAFWIWLRARRGQRGLDSSHQ